MKQKPNGLTKSNSKAEAVEKSAALSFQNGGWTMKLRVILSKEVNTALKAPKRPDRTVDMQMVEDIIKDFFLYGWYVQELIFDSEEMRNFDNIVDAFKKYIDNEKLSCTLIQRGWRIFLRNDSIPVSEIEYYGKAIRREGKSASPRNRKR
ncbi:MAG: hypothetical protein MR633_03265 [Faecalibacterium prausnitzii]|nr:hypothetical protein [Faecalibacterium prausnitzii]